MVLRADFAVGMSWIVKGERDGRDFNRPSTSRKFGVWKLMVWFFCVLGKVFSGKVVGDEW